MTLIEDRPHNLPGETRREFLERAVRAILELRSKGDVEAMLEWAAPDFSYRPLGEWSKPPYVPDQCDRRAFGEALRLFNIEYEVLDSEIHELLIDGDRVAAHRTARTRNRGAGATVNVDAWDVFRFRDNVVVEFAAYLDTATLLKLQGPAFSGMG
jgi:ketosteroid isomerase-like protein